MLRYSYTANLAGRPAHIIDYNRDKMAAYCVPGSNGCGLLLDRNTARPSWFPHSVEMARHAEALVCSL